MCIRDRKAAEAFSYGDNMRAGGEYRKHLAQVSIRRLMDQISREEEDVYKRQPKGSSGYSVCAAAR